MHKIEVLHFLADGRVGGPQVRIVRVHAAMQTGCGPVAAVVACPLTQPENFFDRSEMRHIEMQWHKPKAESPILTGLVWLFSGLWQDMAACRKIIRQFPEAIVHVNGAILVSATIAASLQRAKWVWHLNDTSVPSLLVLVVRSLLVLGGGKPIAASSAVIRYYDLAQDTTILYPPVEIVAERPCVDETIRRIGVMANISPGKGIEDVVEAFFLAQERKPDLHLVIAGRVLENKRWYFESLQKRVQELGIADKVEFNGFVSDPLDWMINIDIFVFSSHFEAAPVALIEALSCGLPVISGDIPPTREVLGGCGILTPLGDAKAMADAIMELVENSDLRRDLSRKAAARAREVFSADVIANRYCKVYSELLKVKL